MDWIDGQTDTSTLSWRQQLGVTQATINCKDVAIRITPATCVAWIQQNPISGITAFVPYIDPTASTLLSNATLFSQATRGVTQIPEIDIDDFLTSWESWADTMSNAPQFLNQFITNLKSSNPSLKFGVTLYEDELDSPYLSNAQMPAATRARFDVIRLFLHYRTDGPNYATYVAQAKAAFPNASIEAGVYAYDRIDYWQCSPASTAACTTAQELSYFQQALNVQVQLLQQGQVAALDIYPGYFGAESLLYGSASDHLACNDVTRCVNNSITMRGDLLAAHTSYNLTSPPGSGTVTPTVSARVFPNPWRRDRHLGAPVTFDELVPGCVVKIFTISGHIVKTLTSSTSSVVWDLKNDSGNHVASGIYIYLVTHTQGGLDRGKLAIIN